MNNETSRTRSAIDRRRRSLVAVGALSAVAATLFVGCTNKTESADGAELTIDVVSTDTECQLSTTTADSATIVFNVSNNGSRATEFYLLSEDGGRVVAEVENIGPGITRKLVAKATPGKYLTACIPGMTGKGIRAEFTVTGAATTTTPG